MKIVVDDLSGPEIAEFLEAHFQELRPTAPLESNHALELAELRKPEVICWSVWDGDSLVGCGALARLDPGHAELKSMRTAPKRKRSGIATGLLSHIISHARELGFKRLSLETGSAEYFRPARQLYEKFGFSYCEPFANYWDDPHSVFMTKPL